MLILVRFVAWSRQNKGGPSIVSGGVSGQCETNLVIVYNEINLKVYSRIL